ncbi:hypothetical protein [Paenibacillus sp. MCAF9]|uniref:hypothetical protein n=1 Tax=unclassified Paenibacillus TaxID=185978 RepID=UPI003F9B7CA5
MLAIGKNTGVDEIESCSYEEAVHVLGPAAWGASINQRISGLRAEQQLQWNSSANSIVKEMEKCSYQAMAKIKR